MLREELKERLYFEASVLLFSQEYARLIGFRRILLHARWKTQNTHFELYMFGTYGLNNRLWVEYLHATRRSKIHNLVCLEPIEIYWSFRLGSTQIFLLVQNGLTNNRLLVRSLSEHHILHIRFVLYWDDTNGYNNSQIKMLRKFWNPRSRNVKNRQIQSTKWWRQRTT